MAKKRNNPNERALKTNDGNQTYPEYGDRERQVSKEERQHITNTYHQEW